MKEVAQATEHRYRNRALAGNMSDLPSVQHIYQACQHAL
jgi:hypothetical protein